MSTLFSSSAVRLAVLSVSALYAQAATAQTPQLKEVTITGNPLGASDLIAPSAQRPVFGRRAAAALQNHAG